MAEALLKSPRAELLRDPAGRIEAAYLRIQEPGVKAVRSVQPDPDHMVYFHVDGEGMPVSLVFHEPVFGVPFWNIVRMMVADPQGVPSAPGTRAVRAFLADPGQVIATMVEIAGMLAHLLVRDTAESALRGSGSARPA